VKPEAVEFVVYAQKMLGDASKMLDANLPEHAARTAYLACFHTARAYVFERSGNVAKTHKGVHSEFYRLSKDDLRVDPELRVFLSRAYTYKATSDYETGPEDMTTAEDAKEALRSPRASSWNSHG